MCQRLYRLTLIDKASDKQIGGQVDVPSPPHRGDLLVHDAGVWEVIRAQTELPHTHETVEEAREPIHVSVLIELADDDNTV